MDAHEIIAALGGREPVAKATGADANTVLYWEKRGRIPVERWNALLDLAGSIPGCNVTLAVLHGHIPARRARSIPADTAAA